MFSIQGITFGFLFTAIFQFLGKTGSNNANITSLSLLPSYDVTLRSLPFTRMIISRATGKKLKELRVFLIWSKCKRELTECQGFVLLFWNAFYFTLFYFYSFATNEIAWESRCLALTDNDLRIYLDVWTAMLAKISEAVLFMLMDW